MDEIIALSYRGNNSAMSIILQGPFSQCFHFYYLAEIWKLFQIQSCLEVYDNFKGHLAGQLLSPDKQSLPKYNTFNKLLFLYYCPPVIILRQKTLSYSPLNYSTFFTLLVHCYITPTMEMYPGMNYVCLIQETHLQIYSWSQQWHDPPAIIFENSHVHFNEQFNILRYDGAPSWETLYLCLGLLWPRTMDYIFLRMTIKVLATPQPVIKSSLLHHWRSSRLRFCHIDLGWALHSVRNIYKSFDVPCQILGHK